MSPEARGTVLYATSLLVAVSAAGAALPYPPQALVTALFGLNLAFALVAFAGVWLSIPRGPDAVLSFGASR